MCVATPATPNTLDPVAQGRAELCLLNAGAGCLRLPRCPACSVPVALLTTSFAETLDASGGRAGTPQAVELKQHASGGAKQ